MAPGARLRAGRATVVAEEDTSHRPKRDASRRAKEEN